MAERQLSQVYSAEEHLANIHSECLHLNKDNQFILLSAILTCYSTEFHYANCHSTFCTSVECCGALCREKCPHDPQSTFHSLGQSYTNLSKNTQFL